jgi:hypothetical protein
MRQTRCHSEYNKRYRQMGGIPPENRPYANLEGVYGQSKEL